MWNQISPYPAALIPTVVVAVIFYFLIKAMLEGDRRERAAVAKWEPEQERRQARQAPEEKPSASS